MGRFGPNVLEVSEGRLDGPGIVGRADGCEVETVAHDGDGGHVRREGVAAVAGTADEVPGILSRSALLGSAAIRPGFRGRLPQRTSMGSFSEQWSDKNPAK